MLLYFIAYAISLMYSLDLIRSPPGLVATLAVLRACDDRHEI